MNTDERAVPGTTAERPASDGDGDADDPGRGSRDWWHRDHPTFAALSGFFTGLAFVILVPGLWAAVLRAFFDRDTAEDLFPFVAVVLAVPLVLIAVPRTRRFGRYMLLGMLSTAVVVVGVAAVVVWILIKAEG